MRSGNHFYCNFLYYLLYCKSIVFFCQRWIIKVTIIRVSGDAENLCAITIVGTVLNGEIELTMRD